MRQAEASVKRKRIYIITSVLLVVLLLGACATPERSGNQTAGQAASVSVSETVVEEVEAPQETPVKSTSDTSRPIATPKVSDANEQVWSSILLMQEAGGKTEEKKPSFDKLDALIAEVKAETTPVEEIKTEEPVTEELQIEEEVAEEVPEEVEEEPATEVPEIKVLDEAGAVESDSTVRLIGEDVSTVIDTTSPESSVPVLESEGDRIVYSETAADKPSWLYSDKEKGADNTSINVSVYEVVEKEEEEDNSIKPEDILAFKDVYKADRETEKAVKEMTKVEIYDKVMLFLSQNYQYVFLAFAILIIALLIKSLVKHMHSEKRKAGKNVKGPEFKEEDANIFTYNPAEQTFADLLQTKQKDEDYEENDDTEEQNLRPKKEKAYTVNDDGTTVTIGCSEDVAEFTEEDALNLATMAIEGTLE